MTVSCEILRQDGIQLEIQRVAEQSDQDRDGILNREEIENAEYILGIDLADSAELKDEFLLKSQSGEEEEGEEKGGDEWEAPEQLKRMEFEKRAAFCRNLSSRTITDFRRSILSVFRLFDEGNTGLIPLSLLKHLLTETCSPSALSEIEFNEYVSYAGLRARKGEEDQVMIKYEELIGSLFLGMSNQPLVTTDSVPHMV